MTSHDVHYETSHITDFVSPEHNLKATKNTHLAAFYHKQEKESDNTEMLLPEVRVPIFDTIIILSEVKLYFKKPSKFPSNFISVSKLFIRHMLSMS